MPSSQSRRRARSRPANFSASGSKEPVRARGLCFSTKEQLPGRREVRRSGRLRPRSGTRKKIGPRPARGMVYPNTAAVMRGIWYRMKQSKLAAEYDAAAGFSTGPGSIHPQMSTLRQGKPRKYQITEPNTGPWTDTNLLVWKVFFSLG